MTVSPAVHPGSPSVVAELRSRCPRLAGFGLACLLTGLAVALLPIVDGRRIDGVPVWIKPAKFFLSVGVFTLTMAWFHGYVRPERRQTRPLRIAASILIAAAGFELAYITLQAGLGQASHFNVGDPVHGLLYALMGIGALSMVGTKIPLAIEIARRPVAGMDPALQRAVVLGLAMVVVLGGGTGILISLNQGAMVGERGVGLPFLGWNRAGGDLRVAHFLGMHAEQVLPLVAGIAAAWRLRARVALVSAIALAWAALTVFAQVQARSGIAFPFG